MCKLYHFFENFCFCSSVLLLAAIAVERYIAVMHPLRVRGLFTTRRMHVAQVTIWLIAAMYNIPLMFEFDTHTFPIGGNSSFTICFYNPDSFDTRAFYTTNLLLWYILPLATMSVTYAAISWTLWGATERLCSTSTNGSQTTLGSVVTLQKGGNAFVTQMNCHRQYNGGDGRNGSAPVAEGRGFRSERSSGGLSSNSSHSSSSVFREDPIDSPEKCCCYSYRRFLANNSNNNLHHGDLFDLAESERSDENSADTNSQVFHQTSRHETCMCSLCRTGPPRKKIPAQPGDARKRRLPVCWSWATIPLHQRSERNILNGRAASCNEFDEKNTRSLEMVNLKRSKHQPQKAGRDSRRMCICTKLNQQYLMKAGGSPKSRYSCSSEQYEAGQSKKDTCCNSVLKQRMPFHRNQRPRCLPSPTQRVLASRRRVVRLLLVVLVTFAVCVLPHHIRLVIYSWNMDFGTSAGAGFIAPVAFVLLYLNSALNPVLYSVLSESFRRGVYECFRACKRRSQWRLLPRRRHSNGCLDGANNSYRIKMQSRI
ncbi:cholecystokinin receptor type a [Plakobranchus ocellatus]|uniref:Cholecystokinin receptor type a n=1 Tax=Plakobranchus ocellatus TaxID=259542 RepID=A0AAV4CSE2_9GAST|nr:cholecystokinin receptor type a [Plakobranchus ocellatus]